MKELWLGIVALAALVAFVILAVMVFNSPTFWSGLITLIVGYFVIVTVAGCLTP